MFVIEHEGYNDGHPYEVERFTNGTHAVRRLAILRRDSPKVRWRLIEIVKDYDDAEEKQSKEVL